MAAFTQQNTNARRLSTVLRASFTIVAVLYLADGNQQQIDEYKCASDELRKLACELSAFAELRYWYNFGIYKVKTINEASANLFALLNSFFCAYNTHQFHEQSVRNHDLAKETRKLLKLKVLP